MPRFPLRPLLVALLVAFGNPAVAGRGPRPKVDVAQLGTGWNLGLRRADPATARALGDRLFHVSLRNAGGDPLKVDRAFHAKPHLIVKNASLHVLSPREQRLRFLELGLDERLLESPALTENPVFRQGQTFHDVWVRASAAPGDRNARDRRGGFHGVAVRLFEHGAGDRITRSHDLLLTNADPAHVRNGEQFVALAEGLSHLGQAMRPQPVPARVKAAAKGVRTLTAGLGKDLLRTAFRLGTRSLRPVESILTETYHGRTPNQFGLDRRGLPYAVKYRLVPVSPRVARDASGKAFAGPDRLRAEAAQQLLEDDVELELQLRLYRDDRSTPLDDASLRWRNSPFLPIARLRIPRQDALAALARGDWKEVQDAGFNPGNTDRLNKPIGAGAVREGAYERVQQRRRAVLGE